MRHGAKKMKLLLYATIFKEEWIWNEKKPFAVRTE